MSNLSPDFIVNSTTANEQSSPMVASLPDGHFMVTWFSNDGGDGSGTLIRARLFNADGTPVGDDFVVNSTTNGVQASPTVTTLTDGHFVLTWVSVSDGGLTPELRARLFNADGTPIGDDFVVNTTTLNAQGSSAVASLPDGHFVVTWFSNDGGDGSGSVIRARLFNADGTPVGDNFIVNTTTANEQWFPEVASLPDGHFMVTWFSNDGGDGSGSLIRARLFNADGTPVGDDFVVNTTTAGDQLEPAVASLPDGDFVVTWSSSEQGSGLVRARLFNADATPIGDDFVVNTTPVDASQSLPVSAVTTLPDGHFVVTWRAPDGGAPDLNIRARLFNADGTPVGDDFLVNTTTFANQQEPSVAPLPDGHFVVTWFSNDGGDGSSFLIRAIIVDPYSPTVTSNGGGDTASISIAENTTSVTTVVATDLDDGQLTYAIAGGADAGKFTINDSTGALSFAIAPDFEHPTDAGGNNVYEVTVRALDGNGGTDTQAINVTVQDIPGATITGTNQAQTLTGTDGEDVLLGLGGNDILKGLAGSDMLDGGSGTDTASYAESLAGVTVSLATGTGTGGDAQGDRLVNIENVAGSNFNDVLEGDGNNNLLGGGAGIDTVSYEHANSGVTVSLAVTAAQNTGGGGRDTLSSFENLTGSTFNDVLTGSSTANVLAGLNGNDTLIGGGGGDTLTGGLGADRFVISALTDSPPGSPDTILDFLHGTDVIDLSAIDANTSAKKDQAFAFRGEDSNVVANAVTWHQSGGNTIIQADVNGNATADIEIVLTGNHTLTIGDFIL